MCQWELEWCYLKILMTAMPCAMMVYASLHIFGRQGYELLINQSIEKAKTFASMIQSHPDFELVTPLILSLLTYRVNPEDVQQKMKIQPEIGDALNI